MESVSRQVSHFSVCEYLTFIGWWRKQNAKNDVREITSYFELKILIDFSLLFHFFVEPETADGLNPYCSTSREQNKWHIKRSLIYVPFMYSVAC